MSSVDDVPNPHELALAEAHGIVAAFATSDDIVSNDEVRMVLELRGLPAGDRAAAVATLERWKSALASSSPALAACAFRDCLDGGIRGPRYVKLAVALAEATSALDGTSQRERTDVRLFEERLRADLESSTRRARSGGLQIQLPHVSGSEPGDRPRPPSRDRGPPPRPLPGRPSTRPWKP
jgi:hypothetical protein